MKPVTEEDCKDFHAAVDHLIALNERRREPFRESLSSMGLVRWLREFGTVHVDIGRRAGKTTYISKRVAAVDVIVIPHATFARSYAASPGWRLTPDSLWGPGVIDLHPRKIYVDEPTLVFQNISPFEMYRLLAWDPDQTFVLLGD